MDIDRERPVLVLGATGYVGNRLVPRLLERGYRVRAAGRSIEKLKARLWACHPRVELVSTDSLDRESMRKACEDSQAVYCLVPLDQTAAANTAWAAECGGLDRIVCFTGLNQSPQTDAADILFQSKLKTTVLRGAMIIGSGSPPFETIRHLVERLPAMVMPRWINAECQPIAIRNVLDYLIGCLEVPETTGKTFEIGGSDVVTYRRLMDIYAEERGIEKRWMIPIPLAAPGISAYWIRLATRFDQADAERLAGRFENKSVCTIDGIHDMVPQRLLDTRYAIRLALDHSQHDLVRENGYDGAAWIPPVEWSYPGDPEWAGGNGYEDRQSAMLHASPAEVWEPIFRIGGKNGWYYADWLWRLHGLLDEMVGGPGMKRGRENMGSIRFGNVIDCWKVEEIQPEKRLLLGAEMKLPGRATLDFRIRRIDEHTTELVQIAKFIPRGLGGILYWQAASPFHRFIFPGLFNAIISRVKSKSA